MFATDGVTLNLGNKQEHPPYVIDYHINVCKKKIEELPKLLTFGTQISYTFHDKTRDNFLKLLNDSLAKKHWLVPIKTESQKKTELQNMGK